MVEWTLPKLDVSELSIIRVKSKVDGLRSKLLKLDGHVSNGTVQKT